jgi:hypothetical protein
MASTVKAATTAGPRTRSFREFLNGEVHIETGRITGRTALWQIATIPVSLAIGGAFLLTCAAAKMVGLKRQSVYRIRSEPEKQLAAC